MQPPAHPRCIGLLGVRRRACWGEAAGSGDRELVGGGSGELALVLVLGVWGSGSESDADDSSSEEELEEAEEDERVGDEEDASRTMRACRTVQTSQSTVSLGSCRILGRRSSYSKSHKDSRY